MATAAKVAKPVKAIDFAASLMAHPAAGLFEGATIDAEKRTATTADVACEVGIVKTEEAPEDWEALLFSAVTPKGVEALCGLDAFKSKEEIEKKINPHTGLFNYALGLRIRGKISQQMKAGAAGPEKAMAKALTGLGAALAAGALDKLPADQKAALMALLGKAPEPVAEATT